jgi:multicomponent K+:H+ antiporter subunit F
MILAVVLPWVALAFALALLLCAWRLFKGPSLPDRILALDTLYINALALLVVLGLVRGSKVFFEVALLIGLLGFVGTVVLARYVLRGSVIE